MTTSIRRTPPPLGVPAPQQTKTGTEPLYLVPFFAADGGGAILLTVACWADYLRDVDNRCAFCHGDPCAERAGTNSLIYLYYQRCPWANTCPCCQGRPT